jgi:hypothetical protein
MNIYVFSSLLVHDQTQFFHRSREGIFPQCLRDKVSPNETASQRPIEFPRHTNGTSTVKTLGREVSRIVALIAIATPHYKYFFIYLASSIGYWSTASVALTGIADLMTFIWISHA